MTVYTWMVWEKNYKLYNSCHFLDIQQVDQAWSQNYFSEGRLKIFWFVVSQYNWIDPGFPPDGSIGILSIINIFWWNLLRSSSYYMYFCGFRPSELAMNMKFWNNIFYWDSFFIKLYTYMMKFRVGAGVYGCKWRRTGLNGRGGVQGTWEGTETMDADA